MFAINKENLVLQPAPHGGKPTAVNPKTPAPQKLNPKTPFNLPGGNDENGAAATANPKTGKQAGMLAQQFITPAPGPRQVLGRKTTNAKARNLAPAEGDLGNPLKQKTPGSSLRPLKSKITVAHDPESAIQEEDDIPEIEYIPPRSEEPPLVPDILDPIDYDFISENLMRGCYRSYLSGLDEHGKTRTQRLLEESERLENEAIDHEAAILFSELENGMPPPPPRSIKLKPSATSTKTTSGNRLARQPSSASINASKIRSIPRDREPARPAASTSTSRPSSRPTSRSSSRSSHVRQSSTSRPTSRSGASTLDTRTATSLLSRRPSSSASTSRPSARAVSASHPRPSSVASTGHRNPYSSTGSGSVRATQSTSASRSHSRPRSGSNVISRTTVGHAKGREIAPRVREKMKVESSTEMIHRILMEDQETEENGIVPVVELEDGTAAEEEKEERERMRRLLDGIVVTEEGYTFEDDFVMSLPELDEDLVLE